MPHLFRDGCREFIGALLIAGIFSTGFLYNVGVGHGADSELVCVESTSSLTASHDTCVNACKDAFDTCAGLCVITDSACVGTCGAVDAVCLSDCAEDDAQAVLAVRNACTQALPVWVLAGVVGVGLYGIYLILSSVFGKEALLEGTAFISAVHFGSRVSVSRSSGSGSFLDAFGRFLLSLLGQVLGAGAGVALVFAFAGTTLNQVQNVYQNNLGWPDKFEPTGTQVARALVGESIGALLLALVVVAAGIKDISRRSRFIGVFYFVYMLIFWVHTKFTLDAIRGGWMCIVAVADGGSTNCSAKGGAPMVLWISLLHIGLLLASFGIGYLFSGGSK